MGELVAPELLADLVSDRQAELVGRLLSVCNREFWHLETIVPACPRGTPVYAGFMGFEDARHVGSPRDVFLAVRPEDGLRVSVRAFSADSGEIVGAAVLALDVPEGHLFEDWHGSQSWCFELRGLAIDARSEGPVSGSAHFELIPSASG